MAPAAKHHLNNSACHHQALCDATVNHRWLHLSAGPVLRYEIRFGSFGAKHHWSCSYSCFLVVTALAMERLAVGTAADMAVIHHVTKIFAMNIICYMLLLQIWTRMDHLLNNITVKEEDQPRQFTRHTGLQLDDVSDPQAHKMNHF